MFAALLGKEFRTPPHETSPVLAFPFSLQFAGPVLPNVNHERTDEQLTAELGGGREIEDLEAQRIETAKRWGLTRPGVDGLVLRGRPRDMKRPRREFSFAISLVWCCICVRSDVF